MADDIPRTLAALQVQEYLPCKSDVFFWTRLERRVDEK